jgi:hypothetical protein
LLRRLFPPEAAAPWEKEHGRLTRRRIARLAVTPEEIGLCGCWQVMAIKRERLDLTTPGATTTNEVWYYVTSLTVSETTEAFLLAVIRNHWSAIENGTHYRRDVTLGEDACRVAHRQGAAVLASLRNLANGIYELTRHWGDTQVDTLKSWCQQQTFTSAWPLLNR